MLADFQGKWISEDGEVMHSWVGGPTRYLCPRELEYEPTPETDLFALGPTIYFIMKGYGVFPDIGEGKNVWEDKIASRFSTGVFLDDPHACCLIMWKCWECRYSSASEARGYQSCREIAIWLE